jgi:hypothetical protein
MVAEKSLPSLGRRSPPPGHIFGNRRLPDVDAELEEFAVNPWGAPERVGDADVMDLPAPSDDHQAIATSIASTSESLRGANGYRFLV